MNVVKERIEIIKAGFDDLENILPLYSTLNNYHSENIDDYYKEYTRTKLEKLILRAINEEKRDMYLAKDDEDNVMGLVEIEYRVIEDHIELLDKEYIEIKSLVVGKNYRGKKIGSLLLKFVEDLLEKHDKEYIELKVYGFNDGAIKFYDKNGYSPFAYYYRKYPSNS